MSFDVYKHLRPGFIRFRIDPQNITDPDPGDIGFSTGSRGEFRARHSRGMVFDEPVSATTGGSSMGSRSFIPEGRIERWFRTGESPMSTWITLGCVVLGLILVLLGVLVLAFKGAAGWIEIILGIALISGPYLLAAKQRRDRRVRLEKEQSAREAEEKALRERVGEMTKLLDSIDKLPDDAAIDAIARERRRHDLPWDVYGTLARRAVMRAGFEGLSGSSDASIDDVGRRIDRLCAAVGLPHDDTHAVKQRICRRLAWHLIADGRMTPHMQQRLNLVAEAMGLRATDFGAETAVAEELRRSRGLTFRNLPKKTAGIELRFGEVLHHRSSGVWMKPSAVRPSVESEYKVENEGWFPEARCDVWITSKAVRITGERQAEVEYPRLMGIEIDADANVLVLSVAEKKNISVEISDPYLAATIIDFASEADRPKLFGLGPVDRHPTM